MGETKVSEMTIIAFDSFSDELGDRNDVKWDVNECS